MKTKLKLDAVQLMRFIRDRMSEEMRGMTAQQQIEYIAEKSGLAAHKGKEVPVRNANST
ncbi:MAG: hypothetical protein OXU79_21135 [Gemmatimonadota bacterium]|nr:hypothetical protein [Gemmatimonadota bacterium]